MKCLNVLTVGIFLSGTGLFAEDLSVRSASRAAVEGCLRSVGVGEMVHVDRSWKSLCRKNAEDPSQSLFHAERAIYELVRTEQGARVRSKIHLEIFPKHTQPGRRREILKKTRQCSDLIHEYWARYGLDVRFEFENSKGKSTENRVTILDLPGRANSRNFYFQGMDSEFVLNTGQKIPSGPAQLCIKTCLAIGASQASCAVVCEPVRQKEYCQTLVHETGHLLGLEDEYSDAACPDREYVSQESHPWSLMAVPFAGILDAPEVAAEAEFFPRHIRTLLRPLSER